jgi:hypothetical protein
MLSFNWPHQSNSYFCEKKKRLSYQMNFILLNEYERSKGCPF